MHFKETLAFFLQTAPAPVSSMLTSRSNRQQEQNALTGAAEYAPVWLFSQYLEYQDLFHPQNIGILSRAAKFQNSLSLKVTHKGKTAVTFSVNGTSVNFKPLTQNSSRLTQNLSKLHHICAENKLSL